MTNLTKFIGFLSVVMLVNSSSVFSQNQVQQAETVKWLTIEQAVKLHEAQPKTILIDMYTDWCGWCKKMDQTTFSNPGIARYINQNFYPVKFDAEGSDTVYYRDTMYLNKRPGPRSSHDLAIKLLGGRMSYPTIVYIDENFRVNAVPGYMDAGKIEPLLIYFAERVYHTANYTDFEKYFKKTFFPDTADLNMRGKVNWMRFEEVEQKQREKPGKVLLYIYHNNTPSCRVMSFTTFTHPVIADILNESYYAARLEVTATDTIQFLGRTFMNNMEAPGSPHDLAATFLQPMITVPSMILLDENFRVIYTFKGYVAPPNFEMYLEFIRRNGYTTGTWEQFVAGYKPQITD